MKSLQQNSKSLIKELLAAHDWSATALGDTDSWSESLLTAVQICLSSRWPAMVLAGKEMRQIYNEAFRQVIGSMHPKAFGQKASTTWVDLWSEIGPRLETVLNEGESLLVENQLFILNRKGYEEKCYFTFSYSPILDDELVAGIFVTVNETTDLVLNQEKARTLRDRQLRNLFTQAPISLAILRGPSYIVEIANHEILRLWGKTSEEVMNKPVFEAVPEARNQGYEELLRRVYEDGDRIVIQESPIRLVRFDKEEDIFIKLTYEGLREEDGTISGIMVLADEVTEQVHARKQTQESEMRLRIALEAAEIGTFDLNMQNSKFSYSDRLAHIFGHPDASNLSRQMFADQFHPDDVQMRLEAHAIAFETGTLFYEARVIRPNKFIRWIRVNGKVVYDKLGRPWRMFGTVLDITDQKTEAERLEQLVAERTIKLNEQHEELKRSEERYHKMVEEVQDYAIILLDKDGIIQNWNKGAEKIKQYSEKEAVGKSFHLFYQPEDIRAGLPEMIIGEARRNGRANHEGWRVRKDGTRFWGNVAMTALHDDEGNIIGFSKVTRDLTERKKAEDKLREYTLELEAQNEELEQFAYVASHDLQEPLRKIQTFSEIIQKNRDDPEMVKKYLDKMDASAKRMSELIKSVLNYSRVSREGQHMTSIALSDVLDDVVRDFELLIQEKKAIIESDSLPSVNGVRLHLNQLFANLIGNSLKFTQRNPLIKIASRIVSKAEAIGRPSYVEDESLIEISFSDNGIGFDQQFEQQIFTMFQRLHGKHEYAGTGIGLAICKKIMENHGGYITARSTPGEGATFYLYFPLTGEAEN